MKILIIGNINSPFENEFTIHYSVYKSYGAATGFASLGHQVYYLTRFSEDSINNVQFIPYAKITKDFLLNLDLIIFGLELAIDKVVSTVPGLHQILESRKAGKKIGPTMVVKHTSHKWILKSRWTFDETYKMFDFFFCQEEGFSHEMKKINGDPLKKIFVSEMAVPDDIPERGRAPFDRYKYNLIYMGRMMHSPSKMPFIIQLMKNLGSDFHLNILPGSFAKPKELLDKLNNNGINKFGSDLEENYQWLVRYFGVCKNITVHRPVTWGRHWNYLQNSDLGLDLSPNWSTSRSTAGNAKLLEYLATGLPVITEAGTGNSHLIKQENNFGIIVDKICDVDLYSKAIKKMLSLKYNRDKIALSIKTHNSWKVRAQEMLKIIKNK